MIITQATKILLLIPLLAVLAPPVPAGQDPAGSEAPEAAQAARKVVTVGTFLSDLAHALNPDLPATVPPTEALTFLRSSGLALEGEVDFSAPLSAVRAATMFVAAGLRVHSDAADPEAPLPAAWVSALVDILRLALAGDSQP